jgi:hypothetical protein
MAKDFTGRTGLKLSNLKAKGKPVEPLGKKRSGEFPSLEETNFFDPKSLNMRPGRGASLPRRKEAPLELEFGSVPGPAVKKKVKKPSRTMSMKGLDEDAEIY